ncbi:MFS transporter [Boseongicola aestuarii]|uniref:Major Facilitator Superfamily protein n=1 Tax=Boseongicola aestuarii TaxID=1470561 RepID=A0A238IVF5_9RHOB|nr:MFS transporter [Boseongicola aestuarii]SMX22336.1 Major Facilitator Superfamily protein [Boseongicola aestuarii]
MRTDWRLIGLLFLAGLFAAAQFAKIALTLQDLGAIYDGAALPFAVSAVSVAGIVFGVTAGMIVAQFGPRNVLLSALLVASILSISQAFLPSFQLFMALRLVEGFSHLAIVVAAPTLMAALSSPRDVSVSMGLWGTFFGVGFAGSAAVIPLLDGPSQVYVAHGAFGLALFAALWSLLPRGAVRGHWQGDIIARHVAIYTNSRLLAPALGFLWHTIIFLGLLTFLPGVLGEWTGPLLPLLALAGTFGAGWLARWIAPKTVLLVGYTLTVAGLAIALIASASFQVWVVMAVFVAIGLVPGASFANVPALNADPADQARANGAIAQLGNIGTAASTPLFAAAVVFGFKGLAAVAIAVSLIGFAFVWFIHRKIAKSA